MSITASFGLLSNTGTNSLRNYAKNPDYVYALGSISSYNPYTEQNHSFYANSIFANSAGTEAYQSFALTGMTPGASSSIYSGNSFGTSLIGNYYNSINNVALGQGRSISIFEQRLAYSMGYSQVPQAVYPNGNFSNEFSLKSSASKSSAKADSSYDVFSTKDKSSSLNLMS